MVSLPGRDDVIIRFGYALGLCQRGEREEARRLFAELWDRSRRQAAKAVIAAPMSRSRSVVIGPLDSRADVDRPQV